MALTQLLFGRPRPTSAAVDTGLAIFRVVAGLYFTVLFVARGFGIAVGAHAGYDALVGVVVA